MTPFIDHKEGEGIYINPRSILRMRIERVKVPWTELMFETKSQSNSPFAEWISRLLSNPDISKKITQTRIGRAFNLAKTTRFTEDTMT